MGEEVLGVVVGEGVEQNVGGDVGEGVKVGSHMGAWRWTGRQGAGRNAYGRGEARW